MGDGHDIAESLARALVATGVDILDISPASAAAPADRALAALAAGRASLIAVGRGLIADPAWPAKVRAGRLDEILVCTGCDECFGYLDRGEGVRCAVWNGG